jgi:uncharacterized protein YcfJ
MIPWRLQSGERPVTRVRLWVPAVAAVALAGCVTVPTGPTVGVMPGATRSFDQFRADDDVCRQYAQASTGQAVPAAQDRAAASAVAGTVFGAATGALLGAVTGHAGEGAAIGAGTGALWAAATSNAGYSSYALQRRYDIHYAQCMVSRGHQLPGRVAYRAPLYPPPNTPAPQGIDRAPAPRAMPPVPGAPPAGAALPGNYPPPNTPAPALKLPAD